MKQVVIVTSTPARGKFDALATLTQTLLVETRKFPGCLDAQLFVSRERNEQVVTHTWDSSQALDDYLTWRADRGDFYAINDLLDDEQDFKMYELG